MMGALGPPIFLDRKIMSNIRSSRDPNQVRPGTGRMQLESGNLLPIEDLIKDLNGGDPSWKVTIENEAGDVITAASQADIFNSMYMMQQLLTELREINLHLRSITDENFTGDLNAD